LQQRRGIFPPGSTNIASVSARVKKPRIEGALFGAGVGVS
jgi:hypothetical protein